jgi:hypothetical protein
MVSYQRPQAVGRSILQSMVALYEFDCAGERLRVLQGRSYSGPMGGGPESPAAFPSDWGFAPPKSLAELKLKTVCRMPLK